MAYKGWFGFVVFTMLYIFLFACNDGGLGMVTGVWGGVRY